MSALANALAAVSDSDLEAMFDNALADFALAHRYEHNAHCRPGIQETLDALRAEFTSRELPIPYSSPVAVPAQLR